MQIYLVGGAVRDELLKRPIKEKDWVVVGATPEEMLKEGYLPVGKDFPVFLHPKTKEEYALARVERKSGRGYKGFICYSSPTVTLADDLKRRDLTINAMAKTVEGEVIDPYHGQEDIKNKWLRHVSDAFAEDPLRVLRVARFAADLTDFKIYPQTLTFMKALVESGELLDLPPERIWKELEKALCAKAPARFFEVLEACHASEILFPEIKQLNTFDFITKKTKDPLLRFAALLATLNKKQISSLTQRVAIPTSYIDLANLVFHYRLDYEKIFSLTAHEILSLLKKTDAFRRLKRFDHFLTLCKLLSNDLEIDHLSDKRELFLKEILKEMQAIKLPLSEMEGMPGKVIGQVIDKKREHIIRQVLAQTR